VVTAFPAPALGGGSFMPLQNGLNRSRGGDLSSVQYFFIFPPKQILAFMKSLSKEKGSFSRFSRSSPKANTPGILN